MTGIFLTQNSTFIIGPVAKLLGYIMEGIFWVLDKLGLPNTGLAIILFTICIYLLLMPLTIKQQKFSKFSSKMNPELQAIQKKYQGRTDNDSMMKMQAETKELYAKYGVSPSGSCLQLLIQMPILFALYRVMYAIPAYVDKVKQAFIPLVDSLIAKEGSADFLQTLTGAGTYLKQFKNDAFVNGNAEYVQNTYIDVLNRASKADWNLLAEQYPDLGSKISQTLDQLDVYNNFLGLNISYSPWDTVKMEWAADERNWLLIIGAVAIPLLSAFTQWLNVKLSTANTNKNNNSAEENPMMASMKMMNTMMPLMSAYFCFMLPAGMGLYWIAGAVIRMVQQVSINKYLDTIDLDNLIAKNTEKYREKMKKQGMFIEGLNEKAKNSTRNVNYTAPSKSSDNNTDKKYDFREVNSNPKPGSLADKANMVKNYNERNNK